MTRVAVHGIMSLAAVLCLGLSGGPLLAQQSVTIEDATAAGLESVDIGVLLTNDDDVEGFVLAIGYDTDKVSVTDAGVDGTVTDSVGAELVVAEIFESQGGFTLGVVLDATPPFLGQTIAPGSNQEIANFTAVPDSVVVAPEDVSFDFVDDTFNDPILNNIIVQGGQSVSIVNDIGSSSGTLTLEVPPPDSLEIEDVSIAAGGSGAARILLSNSSGPVQGFVLAIRHPTTLNLVSINLSGTVTFSVGAEFVVPTIYTDGGTLGVVLDFNSPFNGQTIPVGTDNHIANYVYRCDSHPVEPNPATEEPLEFADAEFGSPLLSNVIVVAGLSLSPGQVDGSAFCEPQPLEDTTFYLGQDEDADGEVEAVAGTPGETVEMCVFYTDDNDNLQGLQIALCLPEGSEGVLSFVPGSFSIEDTILEAVGTEFVNQSQDNTLSDGDGIEMTVGILLDAMPPFEDQTIPMTFLPLEVGCFDLAIGAGAACETDYGVSFCNGVNASEAVDIENVAVTDFESIKGFTLVDGTVHVGADPEFSRGDCNTDGQLDIADAASALGFQFQDLAVGCEDACDTNDDGKINLADTVAILTYLFKSGSPPHAPFPGQGEDPTDDELDCAEGTNPCS